jgi:hypothetical protein
MTFGYPKRESDASKRLNHLDGIKVVHWPVGDMKWLPLPKGDFRLSDVLNKPKGSVLCWSGNFSSLPSSSIKKRLDCSRLDCGRRGSRWGNSLVQCISSKSTRHSHSLGQNRALSPSYTRTSTSVFNLTAIHFLTERMLHYSSRLPSQITQNQNPSARSV